MGAGFWRVVISGLNITAMLVVGIMEVVTDLDVPGKVWVLWTLAAVAWFVYSTHLGNLEHDRRTAATDKLIADMVERARRNGAQR